MQKKIKLSVIFLLIILGLSSIICYINISRDNFGEQKSLTVVYFRKGVYKSYLLGENAPKKIYFYVFDNENSGHTQESELGIGLPFSCVQTKDYVKFRFGGVGEPEEVLKIKSVKNGAVIGFFKDNRLLKFVPVVHVDSDNFDAIEYEKGRK